MKGLFAKCGARCDRCPAYRENVSSAEDRQRCSDGWHKYLGARVKRERCYCDGCQTPDDQNPLLVFGPRGCAIRRCAMANAVLTCAHCAAYPCEAVQTQFSFDSGSRERIAAHLGAPISEEEYLAFIEPYELHRHLDAIRASLGPGDVVQCIKPPTYMARTADFPQDLPLPGENRSALEALHQLIKAINAVEAETLVMLERLKGRRQYLLKLLWAFGRLGKVREEGGLHLVLDGEFYYDQKLAGNYSRVVKLHLQALADHGVRCEVVPLGEGWLLPSGWMRRRGKTWDKGWLMKMAFDDKAGGPATLRALQTYAAKLDEKHGKAAYRRFAQADMRVLSEN